MTKTSPPPSFRKRTAARLAAVQALFQLEKTASSPSEVVTEFLTHRLKEQNMSVETTFFSKLVIGAWRAHLHTDDLAKGALKAGWAIDRLDPVSRSILRASLYEILNTKTSTSVIINEYLNITHSFFDEKEVSFVNGVLNTLAKKIRPPASNLLATLP